ncbi:MAG: SapC family protein [Rhizobiaceae bacterium]|nr:SapC family protein [Rhizobiaceae bacterium]MCV0405161.1 SapC family protein [Rhizobiaceae bacterium]
MNPARHGTLSLVGRPDFSFAASAHAIPVVANEMPAAMRSYPIVFVGPQKTPVAVTGVRRDQNLFVGKDGRWVEPHYVPAYVRRYPFILASDEKADKLTLCIDRASDRVVEAVEAPLMEDGAAARALFEGSQPTETTKKALEFCQQFQQGVLLTRAMVEKIDALKLFAERRSTVTLEGGETLNLTDFQVIDEAAFNRLPDAEFLELRKSGALALIYCHFASMNSWTSLVHQAGQSKPA